jgi:protein involved in polysaccharide export with SLBB domain
MYKTKLFKLGVLAAIMLFGAAVKPAYALEEYLLTPGDVIKVSVF